MKRVALTYRYDDKVAPYADALRDAGMEPVLMGPGEQPVLPNVAGLVISGGTDIDPALYGQSPHLQSQQPDRERDEMEGKLLREALGADLPILAICRGMQLLNVLHAGGTLHQHIEHHVERPVDASLSAHRIEVVPGTRLAAILGEGIHPVNSRHHQAIGKVGAGLIVSARSLADEVIEGLERPDRRFTIAVQWHPENQTRRFEAQKRLFVGLCAAL